MLNMSFCNCNVDREKLKNYIENTQKEIFLRYTDCKCLLKTQIITKSQAIKIIMQDEYLIAKENDTQIILSACGNYCCNGMF